MSLKPVPVDANGWKLLDRGSEVLCDRISLTTASLAVKFPEDIKGCACYVESGTLIVRGTTPNSRVYLDAEAAVDAGGGEVTIPALAHGLTQNDSVVFHGPTNYSGPYTIASVTTDTFNITATYEAETFSSTDYCVGYRDARIANAQSFSVPVAKAADTTVFTLSSTSTAVVSILAWR